MKTSFEDLERQYDRADPWGYQTNPADIERKRIILSEIDKIGPFDRALDIACGEGWITQDLPFAVKFGCEISSNARDRWEPTIIQYDHYRAPIIFDLILATGVLYDNYDWRSMVSWINSIQVRYVMTSNICGREHWPAIQKIRGELIHIEEFPYHRSPDEMFTQRLRIYRV